MNDGQEIGVFLTREEWQCVIGGLNIQLLMRVGNAIELVPSELDQVRRNHTVIGKIQNAVDIHPEAWELTKVLLHRD